MLSQFYANNILILFLILSPFNFEVSSLFREVSWPIDGPNIGSIPKFQVETSRVLVLTTTANAEDVLLIIKMNNSNFDPKDKIEDDSTPIKDISIAIAEFETFDTEHVADIDEPIVIDYQEALKIDHYHLEDYNISRVQVVSDQCEMSNITEDFKFTLKIDEDPILDETNVESYININVDGEMDDDEYDDEYTYTYEEVTDSEYEDE